MKMVGLMRVAGLLLLGGVSSVLATDTTNILSGAFSSNVITVSSSTGNSKTVICDPGSSFTVITQLTVSANGGAATFLMNGSTGIVQDAGMNGYDEIYLDSPGTGVISLVNSSLTITNNSANRCIRINSTGLGVLNLSRSTIQTRGTATTGGLIIGGAGNTNLLQMYYSTLDLNNSSLTLGGGGTFVVADIQNSVITNIFNFWVGGQGATTPDFASRVSVVISNSSFTGVGGGQAGSYNIGSTKGATLTLDHSTMDNPNSRPFFDIGFAVGSTGTFNIVNGSIGTLRSSLIRPIHVGTSGVGTMNISNSTVLIKVAAAFFPDSLDLELGVNATGVGTVNVYNGTNFIDTSLIVGKTNNGSYSADGRSLVQVSARTNSPVVGNVIIGQNAGSTGTFTLAGSSLLIVTNSAATNALIVGQGGMGTFIQNGGTVRTDRLFVTNGVNSTYTFNGGVLMAKAATNNNGSVFTVGNGSSEATLALLTGSHRFANGVTFAANGVLATGGTNALGTVSINGDVTLQPGTVLDCDYTASTNDWTQITGTLTLPATGTLRVRSLDASLRAPITVMQATTISGDASGWGTAAVNGRRYRVVVNGNQLRLEMLSLGTLVLVQ